MTCSAGENYIIVLSKKDFIIKETFIRKIDIYEKKSRDLLRFSKYI